MIQIYNLQTNTLHEFSLIGGMNFLAHLLLSGKNRKILVGNFIGDFVKGGNLEERFEPEIVQGIHLHRFIDHFTDNHETPRISRDRLRPKYRHYSGVIVDIFFDHFLARNWDDFHESLLPDFAEEVYQTVESFHAILPEKVKYMLPFMIKGNWLVNYARMEGIERALSGMAKRTTHESHMEKSVQDLIQHYDAFQSEFYHFFPTLLAEVKQKLEKAWIHLKDQVHSYKMHAYDPKG